MKKDARTTEIMTLVSSPAAASSTIRGLKSLSAFLQQERARFTATPMLLITSSAGDSGTNNKRAAVEATIRHTQFLLQQKLGFRTVLVAPVAHAVPTLADVQAAAGLAHRVGAGTIAAIGSGAAMDLAKALSSATFSASQKPLCDELVLIPATYGACLAATSPHAMLLDPVVEEAILVHAMATATTTTHQPSLTLAVPEPELFHGSVSSSLRTDNADDHALLAAIAIALDCQFQGTSDETIRPFLEQAIQCLEQKKTNKGDNDNHAHHEAITDVMTAAGRAVSFGLPGEDPRSIPLAMAAALMPATFPEHSATAIMASFVPSLLRAIVQHQQTNENHAQTTHAPLPSALLDRLSQTLSSVPTLVTNETRSALLSHIHTNQMLWNCRDAPDADLRAMLNNHLLVNDDDNV